MMIHEITAEAGPHRRRTRVGRGESSGLGKTCGKGNKGCQARAGGGVRPLYIGGAQPLFRRAPMRGFNNFNFRTEYEVVNVGDLAERFNDGATIDAALLEKQGLIRCRESLVKVLGGGEMKKKLKITAHAASESATAAIEKAGGSLSIVARRDAAANWRAKRNSAKKARAAKSGG